MSDLSEAAFEYASRGWPVLPLHTMNGARCTCGDNECPSPGKHPRLPHGLKEASADPGDVAAWWQRWPNANIGLLTGVAFDVLDIDGDEGRASFKAALELHAGELPPGPRTRTGGGGSHILFAPTGGRNRAGIFPKVDWRGANGYIVAPPSIHASGNTYEWRTDNTTTPPDAPTWLDAIVNPPHITRPAGTYKPLPPGAGDGKPYGLQALDREIAELARAPQGTRNQALNNCAFNLYQLVAGGELNDRAVEQRVRSTALAIGLSEREVDITLKSGRDAGLQRPREAPPTPLPAAKGINMNGATVAEPAEDDLAGLVQKHTDDANALRFTRTHGTQLRYLATKARWFRWDGTRWRSDDKDHVVELARHVARAIYHDALQAGPDDRRAELHWSKQTGGASKIRAMLELARTAPGVAVTADELDADPWLFNARNGTVNLRTGALQPHNPDDLITRIGGCAYNPAASAPHFHAFLEQIIPDPGVRMFLQAYVGYCLTGTTTEQIMTFTYGTGANGKTTFINALLHVFGDYGKNGDPDLLTERDNAHPTSKADLQGARLVILSELEDGRRLAEATVKQLTGSDLIKARFMRQDFFEFTPSHKFLVATNHKPGVKGTDLAIWRRIRLIPFDRTIDKNDQNPLLPIALAGEAEGILAWAVEGCRIWQQHGLPRSEIVEAATDAYRAEEDRVGAFIAERCELDHVQYESARALYAAYTEWVEANGERPLSQKRFGSRLTERGLQREQFGANRLWHWMGIRLLPGETHRTEPNEPF